MKKETAVLHHHHASPNLLQLPHTTRDDSYPSSSSSSTSCSAAAAAPGGRPPFLVRLSGLFSPRNLEKRALTDVTGSGMSPPVQSAGPKGEEFERVFRYFDENGDGKISPSELRSCMRAVGEELSEEDAESVVASTDSDGDGLLGFEDFVRLVEVEGEEERNCYLREAFGMYEMEGRGCITPKSLRRTLSRLGESRTVDECASMIRSFDLNGDGVITFDEFRVMML